MREEVLPVFAARFGDRLQFALIDAATPTGQELFRAAARRFGVARPGVPMLVVGERVLLGSHQIPEEFPALADDLLASGGSPWPDIPGLAMLLADAEETRAGAGSGAAAEPPPSPSFPAPKAGASSVPSPAAAGEAARTEAGPSGQRSVAVAALAPGSLQPVSVPSRSLPVALAARAESVLTAPLPGMVLTFQEPPASFGACFAMDPYGNSLAIVVLVAMVGVAARSARLVRRTGATRWPLPAGWATPALALTGVAVASYLAWVEIGEKEAICGPLGDCNTVQQSPYATLLGIVPIGVLGVAGFAAILLSWLVGRRAGGAARGRIGLVFFVLTGCGLLSSIYLTFLEPFVIGATCLWCLGSAVIMALLHRSSIGHDAVPIDAPEGAPHRRAP